MSDKLSKLLSIIKQTGDKIIYSDSNDDFYVIMPLEKFAKIETSSAEEQDVKTEDNLLEKINKDIAVWQRENIENNINEPFNKPEESEDSYYIEPVE